MRARKCKQAFCLNKFFGFSNLYFIGILSKYSRKLAYGVIYNNRMVNLFQFTVNQHLHV